MTIRQHNIIVALIAAHDGKDEVSPNLVSKIMDDLNRQLSSSSVRVVLRVDRDNSSVNCAVRHPEGAVDSFAVKWNEIIGGDVDSEDTSEKLDVTDEELELVLTFANKSEAQWDNLKFSTKVDWVERWKAAQT